MAPGLQPVPVARRGSPRAARHAASAQVPPEPGHAESEPPRAMPRCGAAAPPGRAAPVRRAAPAAAQDAFPRRLAGPTRSRPAQRATLRSPTAAEPDAPERRADAPDPLPAVSMLARSQPPQEGAEAQRLAEQRTARAVHPEAADLSVRQETEMFRARSAAARRRVAWAARWPPPRPALPLSRSTPGPATARSSSRNATMPIAARSIRCRGPRQRLPP